MLTDPTWAGPLGHGLAGLVVFGALLEGFEVCLYDGRRCAGLAGTRKVQAAHAREVGADFVHIEVSDEVRSDDRRSAALVDVLARVAAPRDVTSAGASGAP